MSTITYAHIEFTPDGIPLIAGTTTRVIEVALDRIAHGWSADEIHRQHPHLSLAQIHAALTYYYDHQLEMDTAIRDQLEEVKRLKADIDDSAIRAKLAARKQSTWASSRIDRLNASRRAFESLSASCFQNARCDSLPPEVVR